VRKVRLTLAEVLFGCCYVEVSPMEDVMANNVTPSKTRMREIIAQIERGDALTDEELELAINFYYVTATNLEILGPHFHHAWAACQHTLRLLKSFQHERNRQ
jgi:hypothetical protein